MTQTTIPTAPPDQDPMQSGANDAHLPPQPGNVDTGQNSVYATPDWNPDTNEWAPSNEQHSVWGVAEPTHGDSPTAEPVSEQYGQSASGTVPEAGMNLLDSVRAHRGPTAAPTIEHHHVVETIEQGSPRWRTRHVVVQGNQQATQLVEENANRKRVLLRIVPSDGAVSSQNNNLTAVGVPATVTVPAGKTWTLQDISFLFTASAAVVARTPRVTVRDPAGRILYQWSSSVNVNANQVAQVVLAPGMGVSAGGAGTVANPFTPTGSLPPLVLPPGSTITADAINEDVADTITVGTVMFSQAGAVIAAGQASVFISPRNAMSGVVGPQAWFKMVVGDAPLEIKVGGGIDGVCANATDIAEVMVLEELEADIGGETGAPGLY